MTSDKLLDGLKTVLLLKKRVAVAILAGCKVDFNKEFQCKPYRKKTLGERADWG